ncbi:DUF6115 domain-containing protein [Bacillus suaedae]|uniref:Uncharacterized protein n=1 Tax=Halalkalibacter suaedae TaxID=2822140 RepID=A0A941ANX8_9BACI|nr:hypothetical protein [Bacillus suaedae]MBP3951251.1 hypothetical protein [Bacillus suaedae]
MIDIMIIVLFSLSLLLFILAYFKKDRIKELEKQLEEMSITQMQELYILKKKIRSLEEQATLDEQQTTFIRQAKSNSKQQLLREVISLYTQGFQIEDIAQQTSLTHGEVELFLDSYLSAEKERDE